MEYRALLALMESIQENSPLIESDLFALVSADSGVPTNTLRIIWQASR